MMLRYALLAVLCVSAVASAQSPVRVQIETSPAGEPLFCDLIEAPARLGARLALAPTTGRVEMLYVRVQFADDDNAPGLLDHDAVAAHFDEASYGQLDLVTVYSPLVVLPKTRAEYLALGDTYSRGQWQTDVADSLAVKGVSRSDHDIFAYRAHRGEPFIEFNGGRGSLGGSTIWLSTSHRGVAVHEVGHNLGLHHADARRVDDGNILTGARHDYGNRFDVMGRGGHVREHFGAAGKHAVGWVSDAELPVVSASGQTRIWGLDGDARDASRPIGLIVRTPEMTEAQGLIVETRGLQVDRTGDGVLVLAPTAVRSGRISRTELLDATPGTASDNADAALLVGQTLDLRAHSDDDAFAVRITPTASGTDTHGRWVDVEVVIGEATGALPTIALRSPALGDVASAGQPLAVDVDVADADGEVARVDLVVDGQTVASTAEAPYALAWTPDAAGTASVVAMVTDDSGLTARTRPLAVAVDPPASPDVIAEAGLLVLPEGTEAGTWVAVTVGRSFTDPVVVTSPLAFETQQAPTVRVRNVASSGDATTFEVRVDGWEAEGDVSVPAAIPYLVVEAGAHRLADGSLLEAGHAPSVGTDWTAVPLTAAFDAAPAVFTQVASDTDAAPAITRQRDASATRVEVRLQEAEGADGTHAAERIAFVAVGDAFAPATAASAGLEVGRLTTTHAWASVSLRQAYTETARLPALAALQTTNGADPAVVVADTLAGDRIRLRVGEETTRDSETDHAEETLAFVVFRAPFDAASVAPPSASGQAVAVGQAVRGRQGARATASADPASTASLALRVAPNPSSPARTARVHVEGASGADVRVSVVDALGRTVLAGDAATLDLSGLAAGLYVARAATASAAATTRFTIVR